jgi:Family of unknown function (DUF6885)
VTTLALQIELLPGARQLLSAHGAELPQRDDLCGAFCGLLALRAAGFESHGGEPLDQDAVALAAQSTISRGGEDHLPRGERGRRDYRHELPLIEDPTLSGTNAAGLLSALEELSGRELAAIPYSGPWSAEALAGVFDVAAGLARPVTLIANIATRHLWGAGAEPGRLFGYLIDGEQGGPPPDWDVGHFVCLVARVSGPRGSLYAVADTYSSLGHGGIHLQPEERLVRALERPEMPAGGVIVVAGREDAAAVRSGASALGLSERAWDNGSVTRELSR